MNAITSEQMREIDRNTQRLGIPTELLMENAGREVAKGLEVALGGSRGKMIVIFSGLGNNGGDGLAAARHLASGGAGVLVILLGRPKDIRTQASRINWRILGAMTSSVDLRIAPDTESLLTLRDQVAGADAIVDAIFGTGLRGAIREPQSTAIDMINSSAGYKLAVDVPSGVDPTTGAVSDKAVRADRTVVLHRMKTGLINRREFCGETIIVPIGIPPEAEVPVLGSRQGN